jgi:hypothetical protein
LKRGWNDNLALAIDNTRFASDEDLGKTIVEIARQVKSRGNNDLTATIDIPKPAIDSNCRQALAKGHTPLKPGCDDLLICRPVDIPAQTELSVTQRFKRAGVWLQCRGGVWQQ